MTKRCPRFVRSGFGESLSGTGRGSEASEEVSVITGMDDSGNANTAVARLRECQFGRRASEAQEAYRRGAETGVSKRELARVAGGKIRSQITPTA